MGLRLTTSAQLSANPFLLPDPLSLFEPQLITDRKEVGLPIAFYGISMLLPFRNNERLPKLL